MSRADINLTIAARLTEADRIANEFSREMERASGAAGDKAGAAFGSHLAQSIAAQDPRIARSIEKSVTTVSRLNELTKRHAKNQEQVLQTQEEIESVNRRLNDLRDSGLGTEAEINELLDRRLEMSRQLNRLEQASIALSSQKTRAMKDHSAALRSVMKAEDDTNAEGGLGMTILSIGKFISAIRAIGVPVGGTLSAIIGAKTIASAAVLTQALWMIPGAAAAAAAGIGSVNLATVGFGDAIKDIGDPEKFAAALQNLSPNAQQAALAIQAMMEPLTQLKDATQDAFFAGGAEMLTTLANQYLPMVEQLTVGISGAFNKAFRGMFDELMKPGTQLVFQSIVDNLTAAFSRLADAAGPFSNAILNIINTGSSFLPQIADSAAKAAESFAAMINTAAQNGDLQQWFEDGLWAVGQLWDGIKALAKGFADLAPAGKRYLPEIVDLLENMAVILPPIIETLGDMISPIGSIADAFNKANDAATGFVNFVNSSAPGLAAAFGPMKEALNAIKWLVDKIGEGLRTLPSLPTMPIGIPKSIFGSGFGFQNPLGALFPGSKPAAPRSSGTPPGSDPTGGALSSIFGSSPPPPSTKQPDVADPTGGLLESIFGETSQRPTADIAPPPPGGYPVPAPPAEKGSGSGGGGSSEKAPPFTADPSTYSLDSIPIGEFFGDTGATGTPPAPMMAAESIGPMIVPDITRAQSHIDALATIGAQFGLQNSSDVRHEPGSWHHSGNAVDLSNSSGPTPEMHAFAMYMAQNFGQFIEELIYSDPVRGDVLIGGGQPVGPGTNQPNYYSDATRAQHMDHVHIAVTEAMAPYLAAAMQQNMFAGAAGGGYMSVDQQAVAKAQTDLDQAYRTVEEKRMAYLKLEQSGTADQLQLLRAKNDVIQAEENYREREAALAQARMGKYKELDDGLTGAARRVTDSMGQIGAALADDFGLSEGLPGIAKWLTTFLANLAFAPAIGQMSAVAAMSPIQGGHGMFGMMGAQNIAAGRSPLGLSGGGGFAPVAPTMGVGMTPIPGVGTGPLPGPAAYANPAAMTTTGLGFTPTGAAPGSAPGAGVGAPMTGVPGTAGQGFFNSQAAASYLDQNSGAAAGTPQTSRAPSAGTGGGFGGLGDIPMAAISGAISAGSMALDAVAPGAGAIAGQVAQTGIQVANRTAAYVGQLGGILAGGLLETFLPNSSEAGDPSKSWIGRIASGIAGARPALPNTAGQSAPAQQPQQGQQQGQQQYGPMVKIDNLINNTPDSGQTLGKTMARQGMVAAARGQR